jgi:hypothetical protein
VTSSRRRQPARAEKAVKYVFFIRQPPHHGVVAIRTEMISLLSPKAAGGRDRRQSIKNTFLSAFSLPFSLLCNGSNVLTLS